MRKDASLLYIAIFSANISFILSLCLLNTLINIITYFGILQVFCQILSLFIDSICYFVDFEQNECYNTIKKPLEVFKMNDFQKNIVPSFNQNAAHYYPHYNSGIRVLFVGNSTSKHMPKPSIGWDNDCGMAASSIDKDYVHLIVEKVKKYDPFVSFSIFQVASFEREFDTMDIKDFCKYAAEFKADIIVMFFGANVNKEYDKMENPPMTFGSAYETMRNELATNENCKIFHSQGFYIREKLNAEKKAVAEKYGDTYMSIDEIIATPLSRGRFNHPGDEGMQMIADRFWEFIEPEVKKLCENK